MFISKSQNSRKLWTKLKQKKNTWTARDLANSMMDVLNSSRDGYSFQEIIEATFQMSSL